MSRPPTIDNDRILEVAQELFLKHGHEVTTAEIAKGVGISEGSIFKRYPTKQDLFFAAMTHRLPSWLDSVESLPGQATVRENVAFIVRTGVAFFREMLPRMMTVWSRTGQKPFFRHHGRIGPLRALTTLKGYFDAEMSAGRIRCGNCEVLARMLVGSIFHYSYSLIMGFVLQEPIPVEAFAQQVAETLWSGVQPSAAGESGCAAAAHDRKSSGADS